MGEAKSTTLQAKRREEKEKKEERFFSPENFRGAKRNERKKRRTCKKIVVAGGGEDASRAQRHNTNFICAGSPIIFNSWGERSTPEYLLPKRGFVTCTRVVSAKRALGDKSSVSPKVAATYSPTTQCSTIGDAVSLPCAFSVPLLSALSPAPARRRRAHRRPPRASDALREGYGPLAHGT